MRTVLIEFSRALRQGGMEISPAETIDAERAALAVGVARRDDLHAALAAVLVREPGHRETFDHVFAAFFGSDDGGSALGQGIGGWAGPSLDARLVAEGFDGADVAILLAWLEQIAGIEGGPPGQPAVGPSLDGGSEATIGAARSPSPAFGSASGDGAAPSVGGGPGNPDGRRPWLFANGAMTYAEMVALARREGIDRLDNPMSAGVFAQRLIEQLGLTELANRLPALAAALAGDDRIAPQVQADLLAALGREADRLRRLVRRYVAADIARRNPMALARLRAERLDSTPLARMDRDELQAATREVRRLAERLRGRASRRRRRSRRGPLDVRATVRAARATDGVIVTPIFSCRRNDKAKLVLVCDVSDSVRLAARFFLMLCHAIQDAFCGTRTFLFVGDIGDATSLFNSRPVEQAIDLALRGAAVNVAASSDYGRAFGQLWDRHREVIDRRTTVVVLGDARSNFLPPNVEAFAAISRRAAHVIWLNPEAPPAWGFGDSIAPRYRRHARAMYAAHDLRSLRLAIDHVLPRLP